MLDRKTLPDLTFAYLSTNGSDKLETRAVKSVFHSPIEN